MNFIYSGHQIEIVLTTLFISELGRITDNKKIENDVAKTPATRDHASLTRQKFMAMNVRMPFIENKPVLIMLKLP